MLSSPWQLVGQRCGQAVAFIFAATSKTTMWQPLPLSLTLTTTWQRGEQRRHMSTCRHVNNVATRTSPRVLVNMVNNIATCRQRGEGEKDLLSAKALDVSMVNDFCCWQPTSVSHVRLATNSLRRRLLDCGGGVMLHFFNLSSDKFADVFLSVIYIVLVAFVVLVSWKPCSLSFNSVC